MSEEEVIKKYNSILNNAKANWIYEDYEILANFLDLYNKEREKNKELEKDISKMYYEETIINILQDEFNLTRIEAKELLEE